MNRLSLMCTRGGTAAALLACLGMGARANGQCASACGAGDIAEGEVCLADDADRTNDGCNLDPPDFEDVPNAAIADGVVVYCGNASTFNNGVADTRDTDWYLISAAALAAADDDGNGYVQVQSTVESEGPTATFIIILGASCGTTLSGSTGSGGQAGVPCSMLDSAKATIGLAEAPLGVVVFVGNAMASGAPIFVGFPCTGGLNNYTLTLELLEPPTVCGDPAAGDCAVAHATPGCDDAACCKLVCETDPLCCSGSWDESCAAEGIFQGCACAVEKGLEGVPTPAGDDFDSYADGFSLAGVNGWGGWNDDPGAIATVTNDQSHSAPNSVLITAVRDEVQQYTDAQCEGVWQYRAWQYVPSTLAASSYFILLNTYADDLPDADKNWSTQIEFNGATNIVESEFENAAAQLPLIENTWVELRVDIDLDADTQTFTYHGTELVTKSWSDGVSGGGQRRIRAVDLWGNGTAQPVYYDDICLSCPWDINCDGTVAIGDLLDLLGGWGDPYDINDLLDLLGGWGDC